MIFIYVFFGHPENRERDESGCKSSAFARATQARGLDRVNFFINLFSAPVTL
jgi:hypothetical protein